MTTQLMFSRATADTARLAVEYLCKKEKKTSPFCFIFNRWIAFDHDQLALLKDSLREQEQMLLDEASDSDEATAASFHAYSAAPGTMLQAIEQHEGARSMDLRDLTNLRLVAHK